MTTFPKTIHHFHTELRPHLTVHTDEHGRPFVKVPDDWMWDLVEFLSVHRLNLTYHFEQTDFRIVFLCKTAPAVQRMMDDWANLGAAEFDLPERV